jgi:hypothetical protein
LIYNIIAPAAIIDDVIIDQALSRIFIDFMTPAMKLLQQHQLVSFPTYQSEKLSKK